MSNQNLKAKALELKKQGMSFQQIADELGIGKTTVYNWIASSSVSRYNESKSSIILSEQKEEMENFKMELAELKAKVSNGTDKGLAGSNEVELRKLEMDHEFRMEQQEIDRMDANLRRKIADLNEQIQILEDNSERSQNEIQEFSERNSELQKDVDTLTERSSELEDEVEMLEEPGVGSVEEQEDGSLPILYIIALRKLIVDYLKFDGVDCTRDEIELIDDQLTELSKSITQWADSNNFDPDDVEIMEIIQKIEEDLEETLSSFDEEGEDGLQLEFDPDWKAEMQDWLDSHLEVIA